MTPHVVGHSICRRVGCNHPVVPREQVCPRHWWELPQRHDRVTITMNPGGGWLVHAPDGVAWWPNLNDAKKYATFCDEWEQHTADALAVNDDTH